VTGQIFISYSRADKEYVDRLAAYLRSQGLNVWYDPEIRAGDRFSKVIEHAVAASAVIVVVMTPASNESEWVEREIGNAESRRTPVLPLLLVGTPFFRYSTRQWTDVRGGQMPPPDFVAQLRQLASGGPAWRPPVPSPPSQPVPPQRPPGPIRKQKRGGFRVGILIGVVVVLAGCGGLIWGGIKVLPGLFAGDRTSGDTSDGGPTTLPAAQRLAAPVAVTFQNATFTVTSVISDQNSVVITLTADNGNSQELEIWSCCVMVEQPSNRQRQADPFAGDFPRNPSAPVPAGSKVTGTVIFPNSLDPTTTNLVLTMSVKSGFASLATVQLSNVALKPPA
jgi:hypothetical protein